MITRGEMKGFVLLAAVSGLLAAVVADSEAMVTRAKPALILTTPTPIRAFAADGGEMAWLSNTRRGCAVFFRRVAGGRVAKTAVRDRGVCPFDGTERQLALGGKRALWALSTSGHNANTVVETGAPGGAPTRLALLNINPGVRGDSVGGVAGDGSTLVYTVNAYTCKENPDTTISCSPAEDQFSGLWRVGQRRGTRLLSGSLISVALAGNRFAAVEDDFVPRGILLGDVRRPALAKHLDARARVSGVAVSATVLAAVTTRGLKLFDARTGAARGTFKSVQASELAVAGTRVVFLRRGSIFLVSGGKLRLLAARKLTPVGLTIGNGRLLWAENPRGHGRVYSLPLSKQ